MPGQIMIRLKPELQDALKAEAKKRGVSMNTLCIDKLSELGFLDDGESLTTDWLKAIGFKEAVDRPAWYVLSVLQFFDHTEPKDQRPTIHIGDLTLQHITNRGEMRQLMEVLDIL